MRPRVAHRNGRDPVTAGISPSKAGRSYSTMADTYGAETSRRMLAANGEGGEKARGFAPNNSNATTTASRFSAPKGVATSPMRESTSLMIHPTMSPMKMARHESPGSPPPTPAERGAVKTSVVSPQLRAAVSPHSLSSYRQCCLAGDSQQSVACAAPRYTEMNPYPVAATSLAYPGETSWGLRRNTYPPRQLYPGVEKKPDAFPASGAKKLHLRGTSRAAYGSPLFGCDPRHSSGFINPSNDCYACSVLTLLLRSPRFCRALREAPVPVPEPEPEPEPTDSANGNGAKGNRDDDLDEMNTGWPRTSPKRQQKVTFTSAHQVLLHFARLLERPELVRYGIDMSPLRGFFSAPFFSGEQQDAHEFFLELIQTLETEAIAAVKRRDGTLEDGRDSKKTPTEAEANALFNDDCPAEGSGGKDASSIHPSHVWINRLFGGKLLNVIRCGNEGCGHEIATQDPYVNVCINLSRTGATEAGVTLPAQSPAADNGGSELSKAVPGRPRPPPKEPVSELQPPTTLEAKPGKRRHKDVQTLLEHTLRYVPLDRYVCDACGSSQKQNQGGSLLAPVPPILTIQLNRYSTTYDPVCGVCVLKDKTPVFLNEKLTIYALREEGQFDGEKKQLTPCVREAERAAEELGLHVTPKQQHEGDEAGKMSDTSSLVGDDDSSGSGVSRRCEGAEEHEAGNDAKTHVNAIRYVYRLQGVVRHIGSSPIAGHYVAEFAADGTAPGSPPRPDAAGSSVGGEEVKSSSRLWHIANDVRVDVLQPACLQGLRSRSTDSYLLLYEKETEDEVSCPVWRVLPSVRS
ncbi:putative ubiquitin hydrolase [Trypanosoma conorhini]|uniref:ubiquitinyl hydrolase 1 n=1 Tax=Trypanosoma conorhini TaxID=83891 RepID=A0A422NG54_9TRYP|nr:putative ubiquitin hydrolase [Trypanosoma conorhini]RNF04419.1 putative ubiquitin hydrolase [Trypanosoma conorhini]